MKVGIEKIVEIVKRIEALINFRLNSLVIKSSLV